MIDSLNIVELVEFINNKLNLKCNLSKINHENFSSINKIVNYLKKIIETLNKIYLSK